MESRNTLIRALHNLLQKDRISLQSGIVNDLTAKMIGLKIDLSGYNKGFDFDRSQHSNETPFYTNSFKMDDLKKVFHFFGISEDDYTSGQPLSLNEKTVIERFMPAFEAGYARVKAEEPALIETYRLKSKSYLEATAIQTMKTYTADAEKYLFDKQLNVLQDDQIQPYMTLLKFSKFLSLHSSYPAFYEGLIKMRPEMQQLCDVTSDVKLKKKFAAILEGLDLFVEYNQSPSVLDSRKFFKESEEHLVGTYDISMTQCHVIEETLLKLAGAAWGAEGKSKIRKGSHEARIVLDITDIDQANTDKLLDCIKQFGDVTAVEGKGEQRRGYALPESMERASAAPESRGYGYSGSRTKEIEKEKHSIEVDAGVFYQSVYPKIKEALARIAVDNPEVVACYQEKSKQYLCEMRAKAAGLCHAKAPACHGTLFPAVSAASPEPMPAPVPASVPDKTAP